MASKDIQLRKRLIRTVVLVGSALVLLTIGAEVLSGYDDDAVAEKSKKQGENDVIRSEYESVKGLLGVQYEVSSAYHVYIDNHNKELALDREAVTGLLKNLREKHHLANNIEVTFSPISDVPESTFPLKTGILVKSDVTVTFGALTDSSVYNFIEALQRELPGIVLIRDLKLKRADPSRIPQSVLLDLAQQHKIGTLVEGELAFTLLGIRHRSEGDKPANGLANGR